MLKGVYFHLWAIGYCILRPLVDRIQSVADHCWRKAAYHMDMPEMADRDRFNE